MLQHQPHTALLQEGYGVIVLNTNRNHDIVDGVRQPIRVSVCMHAHVQCIFHTLCLCMCKAQYVLQANLDHI